jgi:hypothetical protein
MEVVEKKKSKINIDNNNDKDYGELLLPNSLKSSGTNQDYVGGEVVINSVEKETAEKMNQGKVFMLNYFDTNSRGYKKILVKKYNTKNV